MKGLQLPDLRSRRSRRDTPSLGEIAEGSWMAGMGVNSPRYHPRRFAGPMSQLINAGVA